MAKKVIKITGVVGASPFLLPYMEGDIVSVDEKLAEELVEAKRAEYTKEKVTYKPVKLESAKKVSSDNGKCKEELELLGTQNAELSKIVEELTAENADIAKANDILNAKVEELTVEIEKLKNVKKEK